MVDAKPSVEPGNWVDPYRAYTFNVLIQNIPAANFVEVSGLRIRIRPIPVREGGLHAVVRAVPGQVDYPPVTLRQGLTSSPLLFEWVRDISNGVMRREEMSIVALDSTGSFEVIRWNLSQAWPCDWIGASLAGSSTDVAIETLVIAHEGITREDVSGAGAGAAPAGG